MYTGFWWGNQRKGPLRSPGCIWDDNIKIVLKEVGCVGMDWINLVHDRDWWQALQNEVMNLRVT